MSQLYSNTLLSPPSETDNGEPLNTSIITKRAKGVTTKAKGATTDTVFEGFDPTDLPVSKGCGGRCSSGFAQERFGNLEEIGKRNESEEERREKAAQEEEMRLPKCNNNTRFTRRYQLHTLL